MQTVIDPPTNAWSTLNHTYLVAALSQIKAQLVQRADSTLLPEATSEAVMSTTEPLPDFSATLPPAIERIRQTFRLSEFERDLLLLCAGVELDASFVPLCAAAQGDAQRNYPTFSLALSCLSNAYWGALTPAAPLRRWQLIEPALGQHLTTSPLRIDERILHYLVGISHIDRRLSGFIRPVAADSDLVLSEWELSEQLVAAWSDLNAGQQRPILQLCGLESESKRAIAAVACHFLEIPLYEMAAYNLPTQISDLSQLVQLWEREIKLDGAGLLLVCDDLEGADAVREAAISHFCESLSGPLILSTVERRPARRRSMLSFDVRRPTTQEQRSIWHSALGEAAPVVGDRVNELITQFDLSSGVIQAVCHQVMNQCDEGSERDRTALMTKLWDTCRAQARPKLDDLAQRIDCKAGWNDLVLPDQQLKVLQTLTAQVKKRTTVYEQWEFAGKHSRGLGISGLFAGASGTGKTMSAEVMAKELRLDLYRIDLSMVVSKYIGETEKNLARVFDAAEMGGAVLLFDEADALFGKRSEVKDSHDRHANVEVSYLLQRMESFNGISILTTNLKSALDQAFLRRLRFIVQFSFPNIDQRAAIWERVFPKATPQQGLDYQKLGQLNVAGGNIKNIAINAAFAAAEEGEPIQMRHMLQAAQEEYVKLERPLTDAEVMGWV